MATTRVAIAPMKVAQILKPGGDFEIVEREIPKPTSAEDTLLFAELTGVRPMIERYPLEKAAEAYACMMSGDARFASRKVDETQGMRFYFALWPLAISADGQKQLRALLSSQKWS
jgi:hypothetical protein